MGEPVTVLDRAAPLDGHPVPLGGPDPDPVEDLWARLRRPVDPACALGALTGLSPRVARRLVGSAVAGSDEAERLLDELPRTIRSLASSVTTAHERCRGELRGPVLWSETLSARASTFGDENLYVCATPSRAYDVDENRVLVAALGAVRDAAAAAVEHTPRREHDSAFRRVRRNGVDARRFLDHPALAGVTREVPRGRALARARAGKKGRVYEPALALLDRVADPLTAGDVAAWCDRRTRARLGLLTGVLAGLETAGVTVPPVRAGDGHLTCGRLSFRHPPLRGDRLAPSGIELGPLVIDVPDGPADRAAATAALAGRAGAGRRAVLVMDGADLDAAVALIVDSLRA